MRLDVPQTFPGLPLTAVWAELTLAAGPDGWTTVGVTLRDLSTLEPLLITCAPPATTEGLAGQAHETLDAVLEAVASLLDWDPF